MFINILNWKRFKNFLKKINSIKNINKNISKLAVLINSGL